MDLPLWEMVFTGEKPLLSLVPKDPRFLKYPFPADWLPQIGGLVSLTSTQLSRLSELLDVPEAAAPVERDFVAGLLDELDVNSVDGEGAVGLAISLQRSDIEASDAPDIVADMRTAIERFASDEERADLLARIDERSTLIVGVVTRKPAITRELKRRSIRQGTQPAISSIRTLVQLRPLFEEDEEGNATGIECMIPAMTLELKFDRNEHEHTATYSLDEETLQKMLDQLQRTQDKWRLLHEEYHDQICE